MGLLDDIRTEASEFIANSDEFATSLTFTVPGQEPFTINGLATVHSRSFDSEGLPIVSDNSHILVSEVDINNLGYTTRRGNKLIIEGWIVEFDHAVGHVKAILSVPSPDSTLGLIQVMLTNYKSL